METPLFADLIKNPFGADGGKTYNFFRNTEAADVENPKAFCSNQCIPYDEEDTEIPPTNKYFSSQTGKLQGLHQAAELGLLLIIWYISSSFANNFNKTILNDFVFPYPLTLTMFQFGFISLSCYFLFKAFPNHFRLQSLRWNLFWEAIVPLCLSGICAHLLTQISLQQVPVSFTHTVKATSPIFTIMLSSWYGFSEQYSPMLLFSIVPIIGGVALCTFSELNFTLLGFVAALGSTIVFSWQNTFSKKIFKEYEKLDHVNLLFYISSFSFVMTFLPWLVIDLPRIGLFVPATELLLPGSSPSTLWIAGMFLGNGICHFGQNIAAFSFLSQVSPLTYTIFNSLKRIFVIVCAILYFGNAVNASNITGIGLAILGVAMYNKAKLDIKNSA